MYLCFFFIRRSPQADWTNELTLTELRLSSVYLWSDGTHRHQRYDRLSLSTPPASFNHFVQLIIAVITFPDSFFFLVCKSKTSLSPLSLLEVASLHFTLSLRCLVWFLFQYIQELFSSRKCALISIIHTVESAQVNVSWKAVLVVFTVFSVLELNRRGSLFWSSF